MSSDFRGRLLASLVLKTNLLHAGSYSLPPSGRLTIGGGGSAKGVSPTKC